MATHHSRREYQPRRRRNSETDRLSPEPRENRGSSRDGGRGNFGRREDGWPRGYRPRPYPGLTGNSSSLSTGDLRSVLTERRRHRVGDRRDYSDYYSNQPNTSTPYFRRQSRDYYEHSRVSYSDDHFHSSGTYGSRMNFVRNVIDEELFRRGMIKHEPPFHHHSRPSWNSPSVETTQNYYALRDAGRYSYPGATSASAEPIPKSPQKKVKSKVVRMDLEKKEAFVQAEEDLESISSASSSSSSSNSSSSSSTSSSCSSTCSSKSCRKNLSKGSVFSTNATNNSSEFRTSVTNSSTELSSSGPLNALEFSSSLNNTSSEGGSHDSGNASLTELTPRRSDPRGFALGQLRRFTRWVLSCCVQRYMPSIRPPKLRGMQMGLQRDTDITKWTNCGIQNVIMVEKDCPESDVVKQAHQQSLREGNAFNIEWVNLDFTREVWRHQTVDIACSHLTLHSAFSSPSQLELLAYNIASSINEGCCLVATALNTAKILALLRRSHNGKSFSCSRFSISLSHSARSTLPKFGVKLLLSIGQATFHEALVPIAVVEEVFQSHGLLLIKHKSFLDLFDESCNYSSSLRELERLELVEPGAPTRDKLSAMMLELAELFDVLIFRKR